MSEWREIVFSNVLKDDSISYGVVQPGTHTNENSVPIIRVNNIKNGKIISDEILKIKREIEEKHAKTRLQGGELLITVVGSVGECAIVPPELKGWNVARAVSVARIKPEYDVRFIKYCFKTEEVLHQLYGNTNDTVQPTLNLKELKNIKLRIPLESEQQSIAEVLSSLDDKIDLLHRQNKTLEQMAETLFRQWFVEEKEEITEEVQLTHYANHIKKSINPANTPELIFNHYSLPAYDNGQKPEQQSGKEILSNKYKIESGQILISKLNPRTPRVWYIHNCNQASICSTEFQVFQPKNKEFAEFVYCWLKSSDTKDILSGAASGTSGSHQRVSPDDICALTIFRPDETKIMEFHLMCKDWLTKIAVNNQQIGILEKLRDSILPKLMNGTVRVTNN